MKPILDFQVIDHGVTGSQFFQGCGTSFTPFEVCETGIGDTATEALDSALEQLAEVGWEVTDAFVEQCRKDLDPSTCDESKCKGCEFENRGEDEECPDSCETWHFVSVRVS